MLALLLVIPAVGAVLGLRFKVVVLAPAMLLISAVTVAFGIASSQGVPFILLMVFADYLGSGDIARHKAETSARFPFPTRGIEQLAYGKDLKGGTVPGNGTGTRHHCLCRRLADHDRRQNANRRHWRQRRHRDYWAQPKIYLVHNLSA